MPPGRRCGVCNLNWPPSAGAPISCPKCDGETRYISDLDHVMSAAEADFKKKEIKFDEYYAERGERPLPWQMQRDVDAAVRKAEHQHALELLWQRSSALAP